VCLVIHLGEMLEIEVRVNLRGRNQMMPTQIRASRLPPNPIPLSEGPPSPRQVRKAALLYMLLAVNDCLSEPCEALLPLRS